VASPDGAPGAAAAGGRRWARSADAAALLERFFVAGAAGFVGTRAYLALTGYPQIGGHGLHVAHLLWGGLLMAVSLVMGFAFLGRRLRGRLALAAGVGFGLFIDELGKFITSDVDYFYRPAMPLIYAVFVVLFLACRAIVDRAEETPATALAQALELLQSGALRGLDAADRDRAAGLLRTASPSEPLAAALLAALPSATQPAPAAGRVAAAAAGWYRRAVAAPWFVPLVVLLAAAQGLTSLGELASELVRDPAFRPGDPQVGPLDAVKAGATALACGLVAVGVVVLPRSRPAAYGWMKRGVLASLLLVQPLAFYTAQVLALWGLGFHLALLAGLEYAIGREAPAAADRTAQDRAGVEPAAAD
jgi:hypothetical protein